MAVMFLSEFIVTVAVSGVGVPVTPPDQPVNFIPTSGMAVNVTMVPVKNLVEQIDPQLMIDPSIPAGDAVTIPVPAPDLINVSIYTGSKLAVTDLAAFIVIERGLVVLEAAPLQPANVIPVFGVAVSVTEVPLTKSAEQVAPQFTPEGNEVTVPEPAPALVTVNVKY